MAPQRIGNYRITGRLGAGGMGVVYRARNDALAREVALKVVVWDQRADADWRQRVLREARALAAIDHPRVVRCYDAGEGRDLVYLAMELLPGGDAAALLRAGRLELRRALEIMRDAAAGAQAIHDAGLIHRDIKPSNIFLDGAGRAKLADLGLVRPVVDHESLTASHAVVGTPAFLSPEQATGTGDLTPLSDVFSLGSTLFALVTGAPPFTGPSPWMVVAEILRDPTPDPCQLRPDLPPAVQAVIRKAMARDPRARFASAAALAGALDAILADRMAPEPQPWLDWRPRLGLRGLVAGTAMAAALVMAALLVRGRAAVPPAAPLPATAPQPPAVHGAESSAPTPSLVAPRSSASEPAMIAPSAAPATAPTLPTPAPAWGVATGSDAYGEWADLSAGGVRQRLRWCPPGRFQMGSADDEPGHKGNEQRHEVALTQGFWIGDTDVTQRLWRAVTGHNPSHQAGDGLPVDSVSWQDCHAFLEQLSRSSGAPVRLPSEAEWEYACRGGGSAAAEPADAVAWHVGNASGRTHPVAGRAPNAWGIYDMRGDVWQWCEDSYDLLPAAAATDPVRRGGSTKVIRGGSFKWSADELRPALRDGEDAGSARDSLGLRLAVTSSPGPSR